MARRLSLALTRALKMLPTQPEDGAAVELARMYARQLDANEIGLLSVLGRAYRETLETLGMTPKARARLLKPDDENKPEAPSLDELRSRRERRSGG